MPNTKPVGVAFSDPLLTSGTEFETQASANTTALTTITHTAPGTPDYAIQNLTNSSGFGFVTADEGNTVLSVIANLQARVSELEAALKTWKILP